jgi:hypothetical protein
MPAIVFSLTEEPDRIDTELTEPELAAIGYVTVLWAELEHDLLARSVELAGSDTPPEDVFSLSFKRRLRAWRALIKANIADDEERLKLLSLATKIGGIERSRHRITHGLWDWQQRKADALTAASFRPPFSFTEPFDFRKLTKLAHRIGEATFQLRYPGGRDEAWKAVVADRVEGGGHVSRRFMLEMMGKDPTNPHLPSRRKRDAPQMPSREQVQRLLDNAALAAQQEGQPAKTDVER